MPVEFHGISRLFPGLRNIRMFVSPVPVLIPPSFSFICRTVALLVILSGFFTKIGVFLSGFV